MIRSVAAATLLLLSAVPSARGQCGDPPTPPAGFAWQESVDQVVTFSDSYVTRVDVRQPAASPGPCGWPVALLAHGIAGNKGQLAGQARLFAARGYVSAAWDIRGQGSTQSLDPGRGTSWLGIRERADMDQLVDWLEATFGPLVDDTRIVVVGGSQGGQHAWMAAAYSGRAYEPNSLGLVGSFPVVTAIAADNATPDWIAQFVPSGAAFMPAVAAFVTDQNPPFGVVFEPAVKAPWSAAVAGADPNWVKNYLTPVDPFALLATTSVPVLNELAWDDHAFRPEPSARGFLSLPTGTPRMLVLSTGGHGSPDNIGEQARRADFRIRFLDHYAKGTANGIETESPVQYSVTPSSFAEYVSSTSIWRHRAASTWPPADVRMHRFQVRSGLALDPSAPGAPEPPDGLFHTVPPGFDMQDAINGGFNAALLLSFVPGARIDFTSTPLPAAFELTGTPRAHLTLLPSTSGFQIHAALLAVDSGGIEKWICDGVFATRVAAPGASAAVEFDLHPQAMVVPAGWRLRLRVSTVSRDDADPTAATLRTVPDLAAFDLLIQHSPGAESWVDVPARPPEIRLVVSPPTFDAAAGGATSLTTMAYPEFAGTTTIVLGTLSGTSPGFVMNGIAVPINVDTATTTILTFANTPFFAGFVGALDASGGASSTMTLPPGVVPASLVGASLDFSSLLIDPSGRVIGASAPARVTFV